MKKQKMRERLRQGPYANFTFKACRNRDGMRHEVHNLNKTVREEKTRVSDIYNGECFPESTNTNPLSQPECYDEVDGILVMNIKTSVTDNCPPSVPSSVTRNDNLDHRRHLLPLPGKEGKPVYIQHKHATDSKGGDRFGLDIYTDESSKTEHYFRHFLVNVNHNLPAGKMKVQNGDELIMVNDIFAPRLNHARVMQLFSRIPVDGVTRLVVILRRKTSRRSSMSEKLQWFETSAILVPEIGKEPITKDLHFSPLYNNMKDKTTSQLYKVKGKQYYLTLGKEGVGVDILYGDKVKDKCKIFWKHAIIRENPSDWKKLVFEASLSCADRKYFVAIDCNTVKVVEEEVFFQYRCIGSEIYFKQDNCYLNCRDRTVGASTEEQFFEEFETPGHFDVVDGCCTGTSDMSRPSPESRRYTRSMSC